MYFESRTHAGQVLAAQLFEKYRYENCAIVALSDGGVLVGEQIAAQLHCVLTMLLKQLSSQNLPCMSSTLKIHILIVPTAPIVSQGIMVLCTITR
jgi:phosphoribosylpyrophosphate synthetase